MQIKSSRSKTELSEVLKEPGSEGPETAYWVFSGMSHEKWENMTVTTPGRYGHEFPKTYGHYHNTSKEKETYILVHGRGIFMMQKKHIENGVWYPEIVDAVYLIEAKVGDEILVPEDYGHSWTNTGDTPLITFDNWRSGHLPQDYEAIKDLHGMAFYLIDNEGEPKVTPNKKYSKHPEPQWITAEEFNLTIK